MSKKTLSESKTDLDFSYLESDKFAEAISQQQKVLEEVVAKYEQQIKQKDDEIYLLKNSIDILNKQLKDWEETN